MNFGLTIRDEASTVAVTGRIDDDIGPQLLALNQQLPHRRVVFDLQNLKSINSVGCREWAQGIIPILKERVVEFINCPIAFIDYCNFFPAILGPQGSASNGLVLSFHAPYLCASCKKPAAPLLALNEVLKTRQLPPKSCPHCQGAMQAEVDSADYLAFLQRTI